MTRDYIAGGLVLAAILVIGGELWSIGLAAALIVAAAVVQGTTGRRKKYEAVSKGAGHD